MLETLHAIPELARVPGPVFLAIGVFDGVHLGHRSVLQRAREDAAAAGGRAVAVTFDPHPGKILRPEKAPRLLTASGHKLRLIHALGIDHVLVIPFTAEFAAHCRRRNLCGRCMRPRSRCGRFAWATSGALAGTRAGNLEMLRRLGDQLGFDEVGVPAVSVRGRDREQHRHPRCGGERGIWFGRRGCWGGIIPCSAPLCAGSNSGVRSAFPRRT